MHVGIIVNNLLQTQINFLTFKYINHLVEKPDIDFSVFYENVTPLFMNVRCAIMNINELIHCPDILIGTQLSHAQFLIKTINPAIKVFYIWDLEWIRQEKNYLHNISIYQNQNIKLITRNEEHARLIWNYCNRKVDGIVDQFMLPEIINNVWKNK